MRAAPPAAFSALLLTVPVFAGNDLNDINLDSECKLAAKLVNAAISRQDPAGLNSVGLSCFCKYNAAAHSACDKKAGSKGAAAKETDPVKLCQQLKAQHEGSADAVKDLVSNPRNSYLLPTGGWTGGGFAAWVDGKRQIGMPVLKDMKDNLAQLQELEALNQDYAQSCDAALAAANDSTFKKWIMLRPLGGGEFEVAWPGRKAQLASERAKIQAAIKNISGYLE